MASKLGKIKGRFGKFWQSLKNDDSSDTMEITNIGLPQNSYTRSRTDSEKSGSTSLHSTLGDIQSWSKSRRTDSTSSSLSSIGATNYAPGRYRRISSSPKGEDESFPSRNLSYNPDFRHRRLSTSPLRQSAQDKESIHKRRFSLSPLKAKSSSAMQIHKSSPSLHNRPLPDLPVSKDSGQTSFRCNFQKITVRESLAQARNDFDGEADSQSKPRSRHASSKTFQNFEITEERLPICTKYKRKKSTATLSDSTFNSDRNSFLRVSKLLQGAVDTVRRRKSSSTASDLSSKRYSKDHEDVVFIEKRTNIKLTDSKWTQTDQMGIMVEKHSDTYKQEVVLPNPSYQNVKIKSLNQNITNINTGSEDKRSRREQFVKSEETYMRGPFTNTSTYNPDINVLEAQNVCIPQYMSKAYSNETYLNVKSTREELDKMEEKEDHYVEASSPTAPDLSVKGRNKLEINKQAVYDGKTINVRKDGGSLGLPYNILKPREFSQSAGDLFRKSYKLQKSPYANEYAYDMFHFTEPDEFHLTRESISDLTQDQVSAIITGTKGEKSAESIGDPRSMYTDQEKQKMGAIPKVRTKSKLNRTADGNQVRNIQEVYIFDKNREIYSERTIISPPEGPTPPIPLTPNPSLQYSSANLSVSEDTLYWKACVKSNQSLFSTNSMNVWETPWHSKYDRNVFYGTPLQDHRLTPDTIVPLDYIFNTTKPKKELPSENVDISSNFCIRKESDVWSKISTFDDGSKVSNVGVKNIKIQQQYDRAALGRMLVQAAFFERSPDPRKVNDPPAIKNIRRKECPTTQLRSAISDGNFKSMLNFNVSPRNRCWFDKKIAYFSNSPRKSRKERHTAPHLRTRAFRVVKHMKFDPINIDHKEKLPTVLRTTGRTCFMTSILHCLANTEGIWLFFETNSYIQALKFSEEENTKLTTEFADLLLVLNERLYKSLSPKSFMEIASQHMDLFENYDPQDAHEFYLKLVNRMHEELYVESSTNKIPNPYKNRNVFKSTLRKIRSHFSNLRYESLFSKLFQGTFRSLISCNDCSHHQWYLETFFSVSLAMPENDEWECSLKECLNQFTKTEYLTGNDQWFCPRCNTHKEAKKRILFENVPWVFVIHLKRQTFSGGKLKKIDKELDIPYNFTTDGNMWDERHKMTYELFACVHHAGDPIHGHYYATCKNLEFYEWYLYDVYGAKPYTPTQDEYSERNSGLYMLFYYATP